MESFEPTQLERLCSYLDSHPRVKLIGPASGDRVGTVSFLHDTLTPPEIVAHTDAANIGIRWGHMYAYRLCQAMKIDTSAGVTPSQHGALQHTGGNRAAHQSARCCPLSFAK